MARDATSTERGGRRVPAARIGRAAGLGAVGLRAVGAAAAGGLAALARGQRPDARALFLTPANAARLAGELARMRGAAMKLGQMISMDAGAVLPAEIAAILERLREDADPMPPRQLRQVLDRAWGDGWLSGFARFDPRPLAAASIGQVHRALLRDGRELAIKVQYPGVRRAIDADVDNLGSLLRLARALPPEVELDPLLAAAKAQLHEEADYRREAGAAEAYRAALGDRPGFVVPVVERSLTTPDVLAMSFEPGAPLEVMDDAPQEARDALARRLIDLTLAELFEMGLVQTDPNPANFRVRPETGEIVLLDFGATRRVSPDLAVRCGAMLRAGWSGDRAGIDRAGEALGLWDGTVPGDVRSALLDMAEMAFSALRRPGVYDFGASTLIPDLVEAGLELGREARAGRPPPLDVLFLQRKVAGIYLIAARLRARLDLAPILEGRV